MHQSRRIALLCAMMLAAALLGPGLSTSPVRAQPQPEIETLQKALVGLTPAAREQKLLEGARAEGNEVILYLTWNERQSQHVADAFQKRYPAIRARVLRAGSGEITNRILTEGRAGRPTWDVGEMETSVIPSLRKAGLLARYTSFARNAINPKFFDPAGWWMGVMLEPIVLAWNTDKVPAGKAPRTYEDLTGPEWRGNFSLDTEDYDFFEYILATRGKDKGMALLRALAANKPRMVRGRTTQAQLLLAGEFAASAALFDYRVLDDKAKGAPINFTYVEPVFVAISVLAVAKSAVHPNGAVLFMDWIISPAGQQVLADEGRTPVASEVRLKYEQLKGPFGMKLFLPTGSEVSTDRNAVIEQFNQLFGLSTGK